MVAKVGCLVVMVSLILAGSQSALVKKERGYSLSLSLSHLTFSLLLITHCVALVSQPLSLSPCLRVATICNQKSSVAFPRVQVSLHPTYSSPSAWSLEMIVAMSM